MGSNGANKKSMEEKNRKNEIIQKKDDAELFEKKHQQKDIEKNIKANKRQSHSYKSPLRLSSKNQRLQKNVEESKKKEERKKRQKKKQSLMVFQICHMIFVGISKKEKVAIKKNVNGL